MEEIKEKREKQRSLDDIKSKYSLLENEHELIHKNKLEQHQEHSQKVLDQKKNAFQLRYDKLVEQHQDMIKTTRAKLKDEFQSIVDQHTQAKKSFEARSDDEFYHLKSLEPEIKDTPEAYIVSLKVPEHERDQVTVAPQKRELRISLNRSFEQRSESPDGEVHKNSRSELISRTLTTPEIMDGGQITEKYEDGVLSFKIAKA